MRISASRRLWLLAAAFAAAAFSANACSGSEDVSIAPADAGKDAPKSSPVDTTDDTATTTVDASSTPADSGPPPNLCPAASPDDFVADDDALQACLDQGGVIALSPGPGYILQKGLVITKDSTVLTSKATPTRARIVAAPNMAAPLLASDGKSGFEVSFIEFDGNRPSRTGVGTCTGYRIFGTNVSFGGSTNFKFNDNRSTRAMCGTALQINGSGFEIARNTIDDNGHGVEVAKDSPEPWADGITLGKCDHGNVHDNVITDATDIGIVNGGGPACMITNNTVSNVARAAFAGIALHVFDGEGNGDHTGSVVSGNTITADAHRMSFGLSLGMHPWFPASTAKGGTVMGNTVGGANVLLAVDGVDGLTVGDNTLNEPAGTPGCGGPIAKYTVAHTGTSTLPGGATSRIYDSCIP